MKAGAARCPECRALRDERAWRDPITGRTVAAVFVHEVGCSIYTRKDFDRLEDVAHLRRLDVPRKLTA